MTDVTRFYDDFARDYTAIFPDWQASSTRQGKSLSDLLTRLGYAPGSTIRDVTCGIGTQTFGLAQQGYRIHATDLSPQAIEEAKKRIPLFQMAHTPTFGVMDLLQPPSSFQLADVVLSADNSIAHFLTIEDLQTALNTMKQHMRHNSLMLLTLRDYDALLQSKTAYMPPRTSYANGLKKINFQMWQWDDEQPIYEAEMFILTEKDEGWHTRTLKTTLRAWQQTEITEALETIGLKNITWHAYADYGFYQPIVTATR